MSDDRACVDTNVLVYSHYEDMDDYESSQGLLDSTGLQSTQPVFLCGRIRPRERAVLRQ